MPRSPRSSRQFARDGSTRSAWRVPVDASWRPGALSGARSHALDVVGCADHRALAREIADASITLVRDAAGTLPLRLAADARVALIAPVPVDLTPAETSSYLRLELAQALRDRGVRVDELVMPLDPSVAQARALAAAVATHDVAIVGTFDAVSFPGQVMLVHEVVAAAAPGRPCVAVALRTPYDAAHFDPTVAAVCTYGIQAPQVEALADALLGRIPFAGSLPVDLGAGAASTWAGVTATGEVAISRPPR